MITINEAFRKFLSEQEASLKPDAFLDCEDVILLYEEFLELNAEDYLSEEDKALCATPSELENRNYFDVCSPEQISSEGIHDFLDDYVIEVGGGKKFVGTAARVLQSFFEWALEKGYIEEKAFEANREILARYKKRH
ncbi:MULTISPECIES: hypothetical protein [Methanosarcina]|jgi:hypothetical protein|uniref:Integrase n=8 Tax=Methanosarcina mazei TaxID=2209 RepID=A0A0F8FUU0_METMZ|nr:MULTISPECIES: hypothetical protein [Methanosarcina]AAM31045.1 hypothetical protein MM_1349 [Methanosarcina mazei Go1]AGF96773.1 hypothetical protein MmTuc01_1396 [Methanosarcina mazei Tuc01]AKB42233.1 hypothetical protein MSMAW_3242 [Methanosarcina mazei WWM610]AKB63163.1 hypothetical protein MSMAP_3178 [Methanosarcina mazei SarPi]AKB66510.1 hypothetical protein MSMAS_3314 [Methanosarcina mazei S-6]